jgi:hypothetical protein
LIFSVAGVDFTFNAHPVSQISSLLEHMNGHSLDQQMALLNDLQQQGREENTIMRELAEKGSREAASVNILTIITLIYLPCTVVSVSESSSNEYSC